MVETGITDGPNFSQIMPQVCTNPKIVELTIKNLKCKEPNDALVAINLKRNKKYIKGVFVSCYFWVVASSLPVSRNEELATHAWLSLIISMGVPNTGKRVFRTPVEENGESHACEASSLFSVNG